jgi:N-acetyl-anhydromuramyl-L-alanine amidase AmpD
MAQPDYAQATWSPSPNFWAGRSGFAIQYIVMHGTAGAMPGCLNWLDEAASDASVHYLVAQNGTVYQLVEEANSAWGNGQPDQGSPFFGGANPNFFTISIEHERGDTGNTQPISAAQQAASAALVLDIRKRLGLLPLIPHSLINPIVRVDCPGPNFPLEAIDHATALPSKVTWVAFTATPQKVPLPFYQGQSLQSPLLYNSKADTSTVIAFDGWQYGDAVIDPATDLPDRRWYHRAKPGNGWTPSAYVNGNAPGSTP